jgi:hypothetical protein
VERIVLSKIELEFLKSPESFDADYRRVLRHRIRSKAQRIKSEITLLEVYGASVTENCNGVTEFCNGQRGLNQAALTKALVARERFELSSAAPEAAMFDHCTTGLRLDDSSI